MNKWKFKQIGMILYIASLGIWGVACQDDEDKIAPEVSIEVSSSSVTLNKMGLSDNGDTVSIKVNASGYWVLDIEQGNNNWLSTNIKGGSGESEIILRAQNNTGGDRIALITLVTLHDIQESLTSQNEQADRKITTITVMQRGASEDLYYFIENVGTAAIGTEALLYEGWTKLGIGSSDTRYKGTAIIDNANESTGYESVYAKPASGGNNIFFAEAGSVFSFGRINTRGIETFTLSFGLYASQALNKNDLKLYVSMDGYKWIDLDYTCNANVNDNWALAESKFRTSSAPDLYFKLESSVAGVYRVDDITLIEGSGEGDEIIFQKIIDDLQPVGYVYFSDNFDWSVVSIAPPTTETQFRYAEGSLLASLTQSGWTTQTTFAYLRNGLVKVGKTNPGIGDLISPKFSAIGENFCVNVKVSFDISLFNDDIDGIKIIAMNEGAVESQYKKEYTMSIEHWTPNESAILEPLINNISVIFYGATANTQFKITSSHTDAELGNLSSRFFIDNFKVEKY